MRMLGDDGGARHRSPAPTGLGMQIVDLLAPGDVVLDLRAQDKRRLIDEIARLGAKAAGLEPSTIAEALNARERLGSTGRGSGIALPHARLAPLTRPIGLFARLKAPVDFDAIDGQRVDLVFVLLLPAQSQGEHLNALACVARKLRDPAVRSALHEVRDADGAYAILAGAA